MKNAAVTIVLADDHAIVREGLRHLLESDPGFVVIGEAADGIEALKLVKRHRPNVLIIDLMMPGLDGIETTRMVSRLQLDTRVIVLSMYEDEAYVFSVLGYGAAGYVVKECCGTELFQAIRDVAAGRLYLSSLLSEEFIRRYLRTFRSTLQKLSGTLTTRQQKVLRLVFEGANNSDIGARLKISLDAVKTDLSLFVGKLGPNSYRDNIRRVAERRA